MSTKAELAKDSREIQAALLIQIGDLTQEIEILKAGLKARDVLEAADRAAFEKELSEEKSARAAALAQIRRMEEAAQIQAAQLVYKERMIRIAEQALTVLERVTWSNETGRV